MLSIGLMSGTSMDGIDAALLETDGTPRIINEIGHTSLIYAAPFRVLLKAAEYAIKKCSGNLIQAEAFFPEALRDYLLQELQISLDQIDIKTKILEDYLHQSHEHKNLSLESVILHSTELHEMCVNQLLNQTGYQASQIEVVGYHGQTMLHWPADKLSIVVGNGQYLANRLQIKVVNDFRSRDVAAGGQGAPLAPLYHQALAIRDGRLPLAVINCGGIANLTLINSTNELSLVGFDTGPGNVLIDRLIRKRTHGLENMDADGQYGKKGQVHPAVLKALYEKSIHNDYYHRRPPKSLDYGDFHLIDELDSLPIEDACRTLEAFTADTIVSSMNLLDTELPSQWILAGGGWNNPVIVEELKNRLHAKWGELIHIQTADEIGWNSQAMEAQIFAYLAVRSMQNKPISFPGTTRVPKPLSGGNMFYPEN